MGITLEIYYQSRFVYTRNLTMVILYLLFFTARNGIEIEQAKSGTFMYSRPQKDS